MTRGRHPRTLVPQRSSTRLATKESQTFVPVASRAIHLKALRESLASYSANLKRQVIGHKLIKHKKPLGALDLGCLAKDAGIGCSNSMAIAVVERGPAVTP